MSYKNSQSNTMQRQDFLIIKSARSSESAEQEGARLGSQSA